MSNSVFSYIMHINESATDIFTGNSIFVPLYQINAVCVCTTLYHIPYVQYNDKDEHKMKGLFYMFNIVICVAYMSWAFLGFFFRLKPFIRKQCIKCINVYCIWMMDYVAVGNVLTKSYIGSIRARIFYVFYCNMQIVCGACAQTRKPYSNGRVHKHLRFLYASELNLLRIFCAFLLGSIDMIWHEI